jgi:hypothetical protein
MPPKPQMKSSGSMCRSIIFSSHRETTNAESHQKIRASTQALRCNEDSKKRGWSWPIISSHHSHGEAVVAFFLQSLLYSPSPETFHKKSQPSNTLKIFGLSNLWSSTPDLPTWRNLRMAILPHTLMLWSTELEDWEAWWWSVLQVGWSFVSKLVVIKV